MVATFLIVLDELAILLYAKTMGGGCRDDEWTVGYRPEVHIIRTCSSHCSYITIVITWA